MLQPKVYIKSLDLVLPVEEINFDINVVEVSLDNSIGFAQFDFDEVEFMENTGFKDIHGDYVYVGSILTDGGVLGDDYWDYATIEKDINDGYCISWENNGFSESLYECSAYSVVGNIYENKELVG
ncbi:YopX family protein [Gemella morbillorum]